MLTFIGSALITGCGLFIIFFSTIQQKTWENTGVLLLQSVTGMGMVMGGFIMFLISRSLAVRNEIFVQNKLGDN